MRKITQKSVAAFLAGVPFTSGNTVVRVEGRTFNADYYGIVDTVARMFLHGNEIARRRSDGTILGTLAGWPTPTTRERLNGIARTVNGAQVYQHRGTQWLDDMRELGPREWFVIRGAQT